MIQSEKKLSLLVTFAILFVLLVPFTSANAYNGGIANGKEAIIDSVMLGGPTSEIDRTNLITDNDESTYYELLPKQYVVIDFGQAYNIVGLKLKASGDFADIRIASFDPKKGPQGGLQLAPLYKNGFDGSFQNIKYNNSQYMVFWFSGTSPMNIYELDFFTEIPAEPTEPIEPIDPQPSSDRAILTITMTTGLEKEYDLSMGEVNAFINWYDTKDAGSGPSKYAINKHDNNRGPFTKRTDYVIFNNILTFEVSEYSTVTSSTYQ